MIGRHQEQHVRIHCSYHSLVYENVNPNLEGATGARYTSRAIRALYSLRPLVFLDHGFFMLSLCVVLCALY